MSHRSLVGALTLTGMLLCAGPALGQRPPRAEPSSLPSINQFQRQPSDRFPVDLALVRRGFPYKGLGARRPHTGAHLYFDTTRVPTRLAEPSAYPAIYAVADGYITRVDTFFKQRAKRDRETGAWVANHRYGLGLAIARKGRHRIVLHYSIEPMVPGKVEIYRRFLLVQKGQRVKKGQVIARMYIADSPRSRRNAHIHFNLMCEGRRPGFMAPTIFTDQVTRAFHARWGDAGVDGSGPDAARIPPTLGYKLAASEDPFSD